jgi:hypothetical protein
MERYKVWIIATCGFLLFVIMTAGILKRNYENKIAWEKWSEVQLQKYRDNPNYQGIPSSYSSVKTKKKKRGGVGVSTSGNVGVKVHDNVVITSEGLEVGF